MTLEEIQANKTFSKYCRETIYKYLITYNVRHVRPMSSNIFLYTCTQMKCYKHDKYEGKSSIYSKPRLFSYHFILYICIIATLENIQRNDEKIVCFS